ncbi:MAG: protein kinase [Gammaproteobacteria bacterium]
MSKRADNALADGSQIAHYQIRRVLGTGSFGITYRGRDLDRGIDVAIKEYLPKEIAERTSGDRVGLRAAGDERFYQWGMDRFVTEAQILAQFRHANIVKVLNYFHANETAYFVMEYQAGRDLSQVIKSLDRKMMEEQMRAWLVPVLGGLNAIHEKNYLHRDVKPGNILLTRRGQPILLDFGAACFAMGDEVRKTSDVLTPAYASIEQYGQDQPLGPWSDLYALGATVYRCMVDRAPISAVDRADALKRGEPDPLPPATTVGRNLASEDFLKVIDWMLSVVGAERPQSAREVLRELGEDATSERKSSSGAGGDLESSADDSSVYRRRPLEEYKVLFSGTAGAGKTTAISELGDLAPLGTELYPGALGGVVTQPTTIALDYAYMDLGMNERVHLYGMPGASRFSFMSDLLKRGAFGVVVLIDNRHADALDQLEALLSTYAQFLQKCCLVIGVTHMDVANTPAIPAYQHWLSDYCRDKAVIPPVFEVDARSVRDLKMLLQALFYAHSPAVSTG